MTMFGGRLAPNGQALPKAVHSTACGNAVLAAVLFGFQVFKPWAALLNPSNMEKWYKVENEEPPLLRPVLGCVEAEDFEMVVVCREADGSYTVCYTGEKCENPITDWTPLPLKPQKPKEPMHWLDALL